MTVLRALLVVSAVSAVLLAVQSLYVSRVQEALHGDSRAAFSIHDLTALEAGLQRLGLLSRNSCRYWAVLASINFVKAELGRGSSGYGPGESIKRARGYLRQALLRCPLNTGLLSDYAAVALLDRRNYDLVADLAFLALKVNAGDDYVRDAALITLVRISPLLRPDQLQSLRAYVARRLMSTTGYRFMTAIRHANLRPVLDTIVLQVGADE